MGPRVKRAGVDKMVEDGACAPPANGVERDTAA
jgi:hypothetical protein